MEMEALWVAVVIFLGASVQGLTGFGLALVSVPLLSLILDIKLAIPIAGLFGWLVTFPLVWRMRSHVQWSVALTMAAASVPGSLLGTKLLKEIPSQWLLVSMGSVLIATSLHALRKKKAQNYSQVKLFFASICGFFSGILGGSVGEPGPPAIAYISMQRWTADQIKSTLLFFFMLQMIGTILGFWHKNLLSSRTFELFAYGVPSFIIGLLLGIKAWDWLKTTNINYPHAVHFFLLGIGTFLLIKNLFFVAH